MSEPLPRRVPGESSKTTGPTPGPASGQQAPRWRADLHKAQKAGSFEDGEKAVAPGRAGSGESPVQLKPDPTAKGGQKGDPSVDALKEENAGLRNRVGALEGEVSEQGKELEATRKLIRGQIEDKIAEDAAELSAKLEEANQGMGALELLVETTLVNDEAKRKAGQSYDNALKDYKVAQMPTVLDALTTVLDVAQGLKSLGSLVAALDAKKTTKAAKFLAVAGASLDAASGVVGAGGSANEMGSAETSAQDGDETSDLVGALDAKVEANEAGDEAIKKFIFGRELSAVKSSLMAATRRRDAIDTAGRRLTGLEGDSTSAKGIIGNAAKSIDTRRDALMERLRAVQMLVKARSPEVGGGGQLAGGTSGRSVFDLVAAAPSDFSLLTHTTLVVKVRSYADLSEGIERTGFWLDARSDASRGQAFMLLAPHAHLAQERPSGVPRSALFVPIHIGRPLSTLLDPPDLPHQQVEVRGPKETRTVPRATWETERGRENTLLIVTDDPYLHMPYDR